VTSQSVRRPGRAVQHAGQSWLEVLQSQVLQSQVLHYLLHQVLQTLSCADIALSHCPNYSSQDAGPARVIHVQ